jgi:peptidoglycan/xylan/chitin deacetylase (PgdA/CDA1 family)
MIRFSTVAAVALLAMTAAAGRAHAGNGKWPHPAAGRSATGDPEVIFTFDDGPDEKWTGQILDTLAAHRVQAIFYWVGRGVVKRRPADARRKAMVERATAEGHLIGNHTVHHVHLCHTPDPDAAREIDHNRELFEGLGQLPVILFRVPYGDFCQRVGTLLGDRGLWHLHWDIDAREYLGLSSKKTAAHIIKRLAKLNGRAVVLMHDTQGAAARALPHILGWIEQENQQRVAAGRRPIRIVNASDLVVERADMTLWRWWEDGAGAAVRRLGRAASGLVPGARAPGTLTRR